MAVQADGDFFNGQSGGRADKTEVYRSLFIQAAGQRSYRVIGLKGLLAAENRAIQHIRRYETISLFYLYGGQYLKTFLFVGQDQATVSRSVHFTELAYKLIVSNVQVIPKIR